MVLIKYKLLLIGCEPLSQKKDTTCVLAGGKDSSVIKALADMAGVAYDAHYNCTGIDPPEAVRFIKDQHPDVKFEYPYDEDGKRITVCNLIPRKKMPPTRRARYCCQELKEYGGVGRRFSA